MKPVVLNLDDFSEAIMTPSLWSNILRLRRRYLQLKITMFTVPLQCSRLWLEQIRDNFPWLELQYHGDDHIDRDAWLSREDVTLPYSDLFYRGFKAPWWRLDQTTADRLSQAGFLLSTKAGYYDVQGPRVYRYNLGVERRKQIWYERPEFYSVHAHVQSQRLCDGLPDGILEWLLTAFPPAQEFLFVSEARLL